MTLILAMLMVLGCCFMLYYGPGQESVVVFARNADYRDAIWFLVIAGAMLIVLMLSVGAGL